MTNPLYTNTKIFHFPDKLEDIRCGRITPPIHVRLKPTNRCQHRCGYCCFRNPGLFLSEGMNETDEIPRARMRALVADLGRMGVRAVTLSGGGEPLCYAHIEETVRGLADGGVKVAMLTNGGLLTGETAVLLARTAAWVRVSMDAADRETYAAARNVAPSEFDRVCDNVREFAAIRDRRCVLGINLIVTRRNCGDVLAFLRMAHELGADHVKVSNAIVSTRPAENAEYMAPFYDNVKQQIARASAELASLDIIDKVHLPDSAAESLEREYTRCPMAQCLTVIAADQNVYTCQDKAYTADGRLGSIAESSFADVWAGAELHRGLRELNPSADCRHHCVAHAKNLALLDYLQADRGHLDFV